MLNRNKLATAASESEDNTEILAKQECLRLSKQLRLMENDKRTYLEESKSAKLLQKKIIASLEKENLEITEELGIKKVEKDESKEDEKEVLDTLAQLIRLNNDYEVDNQNFLEEVHRHALIQRRLEKLDKQILTENPNEELHIGKLQNKLIQTTKKLETITRQFDSLVASNGKSRSKIDESLGENISITKKLTQLERQLEQKKMASQELVQEATSSYDQREESSSKMTALTERSMKEKRQFTMEMSELTRVIRNEEKLLHFLSSKNKDRMFLETDEERISRVELAKEQVLDQAHESYRENFETLLTSSSMTYKSLVEEYSELHHSNVRQFAQINELTTEIENLQEDTSKLRQQIRKYSTETVQVNLTRKKEIDAKQKQFDLVKLENVRAQEEFQELTLCVSSIVKLIEKIFHLTDQTETISVLELVGTQSEINSENMVLYISILEQRIKEVLKLKSETSQLINGIIVQTPRTPSKALSDIIAITNRPRIIISEKASSEHGFDSEGECFQDLITTELNPLTYSNMRSKIVDAISIGSRPGSSRSSISEMHLGDNDETN